MGSGLSLGNPTIVSAFHSALLRQSLVVLVLVVVLAGWNVLRASRSPASDGESDSQVSAEPRARRVLRVSFGLLWIFDGLLQAQAAMPLGMVSQVVRPAAATSPSWVRAVVNVGVTVWSNHPVAAAASVVWIQIGLGLWLIVAPRGRWSRLAGLAGAAWGMVVWVFGESFGGVFAPGLTWLFGAPGAAVFYSLAGTLVALPERHWSAARLARVILGVLGAFYVGMAVLQGWPGRGFWQGPAHGATGGGALAAMVQQMSQTHQPRLLASSLAAFARLDTAHGWAVNLFIVAALAGVGAGLASGRAGVVRWAVVGAVVIGAADWVLVQDLGFLGGVGTDPNSMIPLALLVVAAYVGFAWAPAHARARGPSPMWLQGQLSAIGALCVVLVGAVPLAAAWANPTADPILAEAVGGPPVVENVPAPGFHLVDQRGDPVTLSDFRGRAVAITFLDPVCTSDCPIIAQEFRQADDLLGGKAAEVEMVAVVANPQYRSTAVVDAFDQREGLDRLANWLFLTGSLAQLSNVWDVFGVQVGLEPAGAMVAHDEIAYVIDRSGHMRYVLSADPGPGSGASQSSFAGLLAGELRSALRSG